MRCWNVLTPGCQLLLYFAWTTERVITFSQQLTSFIILLYNKVGSKFLDK